MKCKACCECDLRT